MTHTIVPHITDSAVSSFYDDLISRVETRNSILITAHVLPDDDSIASCLSLWTVLSETFPHKKIEVVYTGERSKRWESFAGYDAITFVSDVAEVCNTYDMLIILDAGTYGRVSYKPELLQQSSLYKVCIDHHASAPDAFDLALIVKATSTAEIIYQLSARTTDIKPALAEIFLLGILGDTGWLRFINQANVHIFSTVQTLTTIADIDLDVFASRYRQYSARIFALIQEFVKNSAIKHIDGWPAFMSSYVSREFCEAESYTDTEIKSASEVYVGNFSRVVDEAGWGVVLLPLAAGTVGISFRSRPGVVNVRLIAEGAQVGGGHDLASGGTFRKKGDQDRHPDEALAELCQWLVANPQNK